MIGPLPELTDTEARELASGPYGEFLLKLVASHILPFGYGARDKDGRLKINNGTAFFLQTPTTLLAVTAKHVFNGYLEAKAEIPDLDCQLGNMSFAPEERLVSCGKNVDIATFRMEPKELEGSGKFPITAWPPMIPEEDKGILFAGYPGLEREQRGKRDFVFGIYSGSGIAKTVTDTQIKTVVEHDHIIDTLKLGRLPPPGYNIGGMSGGPILTIIERGPLITWALGGVIVEGWPTVDMIVGHRADVICADGRIAG